MLDHRFKPLLPPFANWFYVFFLTKCTCVKEIRSNGLLMGKKNIKKTVIHQFPSISSSLLKSQESSIYQKPWLNKKKSDWINQ